MLEDADSCIEEYHIYMAHNSRISMAGLNESNVLYVASSIAACVIREHKV